MVIPARYTPVLCNRKRLSVIEKLHAEQQVLRIVRKHAGKQFSLGNAVTCSTLI